MSHLGHDFTLTTRTTSDGDKVWGFTVPSLGRQQHPCWPTKREAIESACWHIERWR